MASVSCALQHVFVERPAASLQGTLHEEDVSTAAWDAWQHPTQYGSTKELGKAQGTFVFRLKIH